MRTDPDVVFFELTRDRRGDLFALRASGGTFEGTVTGCLADDMVALYVPDQAEPAPQAGFYYLVRQVPSLDSCARSWGTGAPQEVGDRDADLALDPHTCP